MQFIAVQAEHVVHLRFKALQRLPLRSLGTSGKVFQALAGFCRASQSAFQPLGLLLQGVPQRGQSLFGLACGLAHRFESHRRLLLGLLPQRAVQIRHPPLRFRGHTIYGFADCRALPFRFLLKRSTQFRDALLCLGRGLGDRFAGTYRVTIRLSPQLGYTGPDIFVETRSCFLLRGGQCAFERRTPARLRRFDFASKLAPPVGMSRGKCSGNLLFDLVRSRPHGFAVRVCGHFPLPRHIVDLADRLRSTIGDLSLSLLCMSAQLGSRFLRLLAKRS